MSEPLLLGTRAAAKYAGIGRDEMYRRVKSGEIAHLKVGRKLLVPRWALEEWVRAVSKGGDSDSTVR